MDFFASRNLNFEADKVLRALENCRILDIVEGDIYFHLPCYLDYFTARYLRDNTSALDKIRRDEEHHLWDREIDLLTSLTRRDLGLLAEIGNKIVRLRSETALNLKSPDVSTYEFSTVLDAPNLRKIQKSKLSQDAIDDLRDNAEARALAQHKAPEGRRDTSSTREYYASSLFRVGSHDRPLPVPAAPPT